jgi:acyl-CoA reductase-like NAD-dependent aldehyde dehydrogenase
MGNCQHQKKEGKRAGEGSNFNYFLEDVMIEESFGPIIGIQEVQSEEEAIALMNDTKYGLTAGVYTRSQANAERVLSKVNAGTVYWNACDRVSPYLPWSGEETFPILFLFFFFLRCIHFRFFLLDAGRKGSGIGSTLGLEGIHTFLRPKAWHLVG